MSETDERDDPVKLTILHSADGTRQQVHIQLSSTLQALKDEISKHPSVSNSEQRIFFLGRELKSQNRSLSSLGIGNLGIFVLHLHIKKTSAISATLQGGSTSSKGKNEKKNSSDKQIRSTTEDDIIELLDSSPRSQQPSVQLHSTGNRRKRAVSNNNSVSQSNSTAAVETIELFDEEEETQGQTASFTTRRVKSKKASSRQTTIDLSEG